MVAAVSAVLVMMDSRSNRFSTGENISKIEEHLKLHNRMYTDSDYEKKCGSGIQEIYHVTSGY